MVQVNINLEIDSKTGPYFISEILMVQVNINLEIDSKTGPYNIGEDYKMIVDGPSLIYA